MNKRQIMDRMGLRHNKCGSQINYPHFGASPDDEVFEVEAGLCTPLYDDLITNSAPGLTGLGDQYQECGSCIYDEIEYAQGGTNECHTNQDQDPDGPQIYISKTCVSRGGLQPDQEIPGECEDPWGDNGPGYLPTPEEWCRFAQCVENSVQNPDKDCGSACTDMAAILFDNGNLNSKHYCQ